MIEQGSQGRPRGWSEEIYHLVSAERLALQIDIQDFFWGVAKRLGTRF